MRLFVSIVFLLTCFSGLAQDQIDSTKWSAVLNTGSQASFMTDFEKEVLFELNKARTNPSRYAELYLKQMLTKFEGKLYLPIHLRTKEGQSAVKECIEVMKKTKSMSPLSASEVLEKTSTQHTKAQGKTEQIGHSSPNGETFANRLKKYKFQSIGECIFYGKQTAQGVVISLLIDDGVPDRGHRKIILDPKFVQVGVAEGPHKLFKDMCTIDFAGPTFN